MEQFVIDVDPAIRYQSLIATISPNGETFRLKFSLRYLNEADMWFFSISEADSGQSYCQYVPLVASYDTQNANNLLAPFKHKRIGNIYCVPVVEETSTVDPGLDNLGEFQIIWGDNE